MARVFCKCKALQLDFSPSSHCSSSSSSSSHYSSFVTNKPAREFRLKAAGTVAGKRISRSNIWNVTVEKGSISDAVVTKPKTKSGVELLSSLVAGVAGAAFEIFKPASKGKSLKLRAEMFVERVIIDCRFFTLFGVAGSLLGSILCFVEGCFFVLESFSEYFHCMLQRSDHGEMVQLLIEAIGMFLVGTALLIFGMGLYVLFISCRNMKGSKEWLVSSSNLFGSFHLKKLPVWVEMASVAQAKTRIGQAVVMILQVGVLEKVKMVTVANAFDLACFAAAILVSSAAIFILSRLSNQPGKQ